MPTCRVAGLEDAPVLADLQLRSSLAAYAHIFPPEAPTPTYDRLLTLWRSWLTSGQHTGFAVDLDGAVVGIVLAGSDPRQPSLGHVSRMYVAPDRWGRGIGRTLYDAAVAHLQAVGYEEATLWVLEQNHRARRWYERLGWVATGERKAVYEPAGIDELRYRVALRRRSGT